MEPFNIQALDKFYARISAQDGVTVHDFQSELADLLERPRSDNDLESCRLSRGPWKRFTDEVCPMSRFLRIQNVPTGRIRFSLNDNPPDCWLWNEMQVARTGVEITIAQGRERHYLAKESIKGGISPGFLGIPDKAPKADFERAVKRGRVMYSSQQALTAIKEGILDRLKEKDKPSYTGYNLVIQAPLRTLPKKRWLAMKGELVAAATTLPFNEVYVVGNGDSQLLGLRIK
jgi:hypothetical protein